MMTVYQITNNINGKRYIGATSKPLNKRFYFHVWFSRRKATIIGKAIQKYGKDSFTIEPLKVCSSKDEMYAEEKRLIREEKPEYNLCHGGRGAPGLLWTAQRRAKTVASLKAAWTDERRKKISSMFMGKAPHINAINAARIYRISHAKKIVCTNNGMIGTVRELSDLLGLKPKSIHSVLSNNAKGATSVGGYKFANLDDDS